MIQKVLFKSDVFAKVVNKITTTVKMIHVIHLYLQSTLESNIWAAVIWRSTDELIGFNSANVSLSNWRNWAALEQPLIRCVCGAEGNKKNLSE